MAKAPGLVQVYASMAEITGATIAGGKTATALATLANVASYKVGLATLAGGFVGFGVGMVPIFYLMARNGLGTGGSSGPHG